MERWISIKEFDCQYQISESGRIRSVEGIIKRLNGRPYIRRSKILRPSSTKKCRYLRGMVCVNKRNIPYKIHRLVAKYFVDNPLGKPEVNHIDGNTLNNHYSNLEWVTRRENIIHCVNNNLQTPFKGEEVGTSKLTSKEVISIRNEYKPRHITRSYLSKKYKVSEAAIKDILYRRTWKHL